MKKIIAISLGIFLCVMAAIIIVLIMYVHLMMPAYPEARERADLCVAKLSQFLVTPQGALINRYISRRHCSFEISGSVDMEGTAKLFNESGLFDYFNSIEVTGKTADGVSYTYTFEKPKSLNPAPTKNK
jgi:hypothetical protein